MSSEGYVYILSNIGMPGLVKIGMSVHGGRARAKQLYSQGGTGAPFPFKMEFEIWSPDCLSCEQSVHEELQDFRINSGREFFSVDVSTAIEAGSRTVMEWYDMSVVKDETAITVETIVTSPWVKDYKGIDDACGGMPFDIFIADVTNYFDDRAILDAAKRRQSMIDRMKNKRMEA